MFIRAGIDGNVTWVPRVSRNRQQVCGARPSLARSAGTTATAAPTPRAVQITPNAQPAATARPAPQRVVRTPQPTQRVVRTQRRAPIPTIATTTKPPAPVIRRAPVTQRKPAPAPKPVTIQQPRQTAPVTIKRSGRCPGASAISQRYINDGSRYPVRCGPQREAPVTLPGDSISLAPGADGYQLAEADTLRSGTRVVPKHVYIKRQNTTNVVVPEGYRRVWEDDRLNPRRAEQTLQGHAQTQQIWTNQMPRRLADPTRRVRSKQPTVHVPAQLGLRPEAPTVSTKQRVSQKAAQVKSGQHFVQVGVFGQPRNAEATAQRMGRTGLPVRMGTLTRGGTSYRLVMVGPFSNSRDAQNALRVARQAGFKDAYIR
ncbi:SPOR domain-containing protein [Thalassococcus sp. S3]|uniref:SPOR domain-containing protein n=1 Tax=Thalassococcus sp. S3 TaxID=2017482 RepID=UPI0013EEA4A1|nr:SPOR domain-containing protein [Thalassococcus sp. S3]